MDERRSLLDELKRRNLFRAAGMYLVVAWPLLQVGETTFDALGLPDGSQRFLIVLLALGFPAAVVLAWIFDLPPEGIVRTRDAPAAELARLRMGRRIDFALIGALVLALDRTPRRRAGHRAGDALGAARDHGAAGCRNSGARLERGVDPGRSQSAAAQCRAAVRSRASGGYPEYNQPMRLDFLLH